MLRSAVDRCFLLTAPGTSALATVRIAGPGVRTFLGQRFSRPVIPGRPTHGELRDSDGVIDDPVIVLRTDGFAADITLHGGTWIARCVAALAEADGFALSPVDVGTIGSTDAGSIWEHELLASLPLARTELAVTALLAQPAAWRSFIDRGPDETTIAAVLADPSLEHLLNPPKLAIVGLPNAGKSTLANQLFGQQRSIVSPIAGTTRDWVGEEANLDGLIVRLIDTPGRRQTCDVLETAAILSSDAAIEAADALVILLDASRDDAEQDALLGAFDRSVVVMNKSDQRLATWSDARIRSLGASVICARTGDGIASLIARLRTHFGIADTVAEACAWTRRQRQLLREGRVGEVISGTPSTPP